MTCLDCQTKPRKAKVPAQSELSIQRQCVAWFRIQHCNTIITSIRNEAVYNASQKHYGALANRAGRHKGIADLLVLAPRHGYGALFVELKTPKGRQSDEQLRFAAYCVNNGYMYALSRNIDEFMTICNEYLTASNILTHK